MMDATASVHAVGGSQTPAARALVLDLDRELGAGLPSADRESARNACRETLVQVRPGPLQLRDCVTSSEVPVAFLIIDGMLCREVTLANCHMLEPLGSGDVIWARLFCDDAESPVNTAVCGSGTRPEAR
jgi:hypothetical protein